MERGPSLYHSEMTHSRETKTNQSHEAQTLTSKRGKKQQSLAQRGQMTNARKRTKTKPQFVSRSSNQNWNAYGLRLHYAIGYIIIEVFIDYKAAFGTAPDAATPLHEPNDKR
jgi:hypothetical protein